MDWGFGNPNKTATLIAMLMIAVWGLAYVRRWGFWAALVLFTSFGICLIHTFSRGGLIALAAGIIPLALFAKRPWPKSKSLGIAASVWIMMGVSIYLSAHERYGKGTEDRSISNRLELWKMAPKMMVDAPGGWGLGNAGKAYMQWYQPLNRSESYRTLVNSHLTWLVEFGWPLRILYPLTWLLVFTLCWPIRKCRWFVIPLGMWLVFFVAAIFSSVAESPCLWIVPVLALTSILIVRVNAEAWPSRWVWKIIIATDVFISAFFYLSGKCEKSLVRHSSDLVIYGDGNPSKILVIDSKITGKYYGRKIRSLAPQSSAIGIAESIEFVFNVRGKVVFVAGSVFNKPKLAKIISEADHSVLLNPNYRPEDLNLPNEATKKIYVILGEFSQSSSIAAWQQTASTAQLEGVGDFVPNWTQFIF